MENGQFRKDLYYRLNVIQLKMPALRERPADIPLIANVLLEKLCPHTSTERPKISPDALNYLSTLPFPGNVRELENMLERALALCNGQVIHVDDLGIENNDTYTPTLSELPSTEASELNLNDYLENIEKQAIIQALNKTKNNKTAAAKLLGVTFRTLRYKLAKLGLSHAGETHEDENQDTRQ